MAKKKKEAPLEGIALRPKKILAFDALLGDDIGLESIGDDLSFLEEGNNVQLDLGDGTVNVVDLVLESIEESTLVPRDLKFDDSSMPHAANFVEWCSGAEFLKATPYLEQALIGVKLFGEYCVAKGSYIQTSKGLMTIERALGNPETTGMSDVSFGVTSLTGEEQATYGGMTSKRRKCLEITYSSGRKIVVTPEHKVLKLNPNYTFSWVEAGFLAIGDYGVTKHGTDLWPERPSSIPEFVPSREANAKGFSYPTVMTSELARLIGYLITDGTIGKNGIGFVSLDGSGLADDFVHCFEQVFGVPVSSVRTGQMKPNSTRPYTSVMCHGRNMVDFFESIGLSGLCYSKKIPACILESSREHVIECLRAMMDCDGYTDHKIGITLSSPKAVRQLSHLMDNLGLYGQYIEGVYDASKLKRDACDTKDARGTWYYRGPRSEYARIIGTRNELRRQRLFELADEEPSFSVNVAGTAYPGRAPYGRELYAYASSLRDSYHDKGLTYSLYGRRDFYLIDSVLDSPDFVDFWTRKDPNILRRLDAIREGNLMFSTIVSIEEVGYREVYDITVPEGENFQCDGIIVHNCPRCSDVEWMDINNHEPQEGLVGLREKVTLLEYNKCPKCHVRRSELLDTGELNFYNELAVNAGQRCVVSNTPVLTESGIRPIVHMLDGHSIPGFHKASSQQAHNGKEPSPVRQVYVSKRGEVRRLTLANGIYIEATPDHPLRTTKGFRQVRNIDARHKTLVYVGTEQWGTVSHPNTVYEAGCATREAALEFVRKSSVIDEQTGQWYWHVTDEQAMPTAWSILLNMGVLPTVSNGILTFSVPSAVPTRMHAVPVRVQSVERASDAITYDLCMKGKPQFIASGMMQHNSGKSVLVAMLSTYLTHRILKMQSPTGILGIGDNTILHGTFVALTQKQAMDTLWEPYFGYIVASPWFQKYHALIRMYEKRYGVEVMKIRDTFVLYRHRNLTVYPAGPDGRILRGRTRLFACIGPNELISTNKGLIPMRSMRDGYEADVGTESGRIRNHTMTGLKEVHKLTLTTGQELVCTLDHEIATASCGSIVKRKLKDLRKDDEVVIGLGGQFPSELHLPPPAHRTLTITDRIYAYMQRRPTLTYPDICSHLQSPVRSVSSTMCRLRTEGAIVRSGSRKHAIFSVASMDKFDSLRSRAAKITYPTKMTQRLAEILGYLVADGSLANTRGRGICLSYADRSKVEYVHSLILREFNFDSPINSNPHNGQYALTISCADLVRWLNDIGVEPKYSADKEVPWSILRAPQDCVRAYMKAVYECDGRWDGGRITYATMSNVESRQMQQLLLREGIPATIALKVYPHSATGKYESDRKLFLHSLRTDTFISRKLAYYLGWKPVNIEPKVKYYGTLRHEDSYETAEFVTSRVLSIEPLNLTVPTYDMTVDEDRHVYQASGMLVSNSIDEIAYFDNAADSNKVKTSANAVYGALDRSLGTVRAEEASQVAAQYDGAFTGYFFNISSPVHARDKINELLKLSVGSTKLLGVHAPTWKMNPKMPRTTAFLVEAFRRDPVGANRDYGAQAPLSANPFITQRLDIQRCIRDKGRNLCTYTPKIIKMRDGTKQRYAVLAKAARSTKPSIMAIDAGFSNNSFAMSVGTQAEDGCISVDCLAEVIPRPGIPLNYTKIFDELLMPLAVARNVRVLLADQWNSLKLLSDASAQGIAVAEKYSLKYADMWTIKTMLEAEIPQLTIPRMQHIAIDKMDDVLNYDQDEYPYCFEGKPVEHMVMQMMTVQDTGSSVIKNMGSTDDLFRATALMVWGFQSEKFFEELQTAAEEVRVSRPLESLGTMGRRRVSGSAALGRSAPTMRVAAISKTRRLG